MGGGRDDANITRDYYDALTEQVGETDDMASYATVTTGRAAAAHKDRLERAHLERILGALSPSARVLDIGGGAGRIASWLAPRVHEVVLLDASERLLAAARRFAERRGITNLRTVAGLAPDAIPDGPFDLVVLFGVTLYLDDATVDRLAARCAEILAPGGRLVLRDAVTTDGETRDDVRRDETGAVTYRARFRPRAYYRDVFARYLRPTYQRATCAHPVPFFSRGMETRIGRSDTAAADRVLARLSPWLVRVDPALLALEEKVRGNELLAPLLAPVPVVQDFYVFEKPAAVGEPVREPVADPAFSVVVIAYNEHECIASVVTELRDALDRAGIVFELVLVDDGSKDGTNDEMKRFAATDARAKVVALVPNRGIGGALRAGFDAATGEYVTWVPGDGQIGPDAVIELYRQRRTAAMVTTVYRRREDPWYRHVISGTLNTVIKLRTGQVAKSGGNYVFARGMWLSCGPRDDDSMMISTAFRANLRAAGETIREIEIDARPRVAGHSKVLNPRTILRTLGGLRTVRDADTKPR